MKKGIATLLGVVVLFVVIVSVLSTRVVADGSTVAVAGWGFEVGKVDFPSPDGRWLAYLRVKSDRPGYFDVCIVPLEGGQKPRVLGEGISVFWTEDPVEVHWTYHPFHPTIRWAYNPETGEVREIWDGLPGGPTPTNTSQLPEPTVTNTATLRPTPTNTIALEPTPTSTLRPTPTNTIALEPTPTMTPRPTPTSSM